MSLNLETYTACRQADLKPVEAGEVDVIWDVVAAVDPSSEALWEDNNELSLLLDRSTHLQTTHLAQLISWHLDSHNTTKHWGKNRNNHLGVPPCRGSRV